MIQQTYVSFWDPIYENREHTNIFSEASVELKTALNSVSISVSTFDVTTFVNFEALDTYLSAESDTGRYPWNFFLSLKRWTGSHNDEYVCTFEFGRSSLVPFIPYLDVKQYMRQINGENHQ